MWNPWEWFKLFYENFGHKHPAVSALVFMIVFAGAGWLVWWRLDIQYNKDHSVNQVPPVIAQRTPPSSAAQPATLMPEPTPTHKESPVKKKSSEVPPPSVVVNQDNRGSSGTNIGHVGELNVYQRPPELILSEDQKRIAIRHLLESPDTVQLVLSSRTPAMADGQTTPLGNQILEIFGSWSIQSQYIGTGPIQQGITVIGDNQTNAVQTVLRAFEAAHIPYRLDPNGYAFPPPAGGAVAPVTVTVSRSSE